MTLDDRNPESILIWLKQMCSNLTWIQLTIKCSPVRSHGFIQALIVDI